MGTTDTNSHNVAVGYAAGGAVTTAIENTFVGAFAGDALNTGGFNTALGYATLSNDQKGAKKCRCWSWRFECPTIYHGY